MVEFEVLQILSGPGSEAFNYFFTIMWAIGVLAFGYALLIKIISRS